MPRFGVGAASSTTRRPSSGSSKSPFVSVRPIDAEVSARYGEVFSQLKRAGTPIPANDVWIAAVTMESGAHLLTFDDDFSPVAGLSWTRFKSR